jgi:predicted component of type VI protein secretion system
MRLVSALSIAMLLPLVGCQPGDAPPGQHVDVKVQGTPDLNPKTDHDVDVKVNTGTDGHPAGVHVDVKK